MSMCKKYIIFERCGFCCQQELLIFVIYSYFFLLELLPKWRLVVI